MKLRIFTIILFQISFLVLSSPKMMQAQDTSSITLRDNQLTFFEKIALLLDKDHRKNQKYLKQFQKTGRLLYLEKYLRTPEFRQKQHATNPLAYYLIRGIVEEKKQDPDQKWCVYYHIASQIDSERYGNDNLKTKSDKKLLDAIYLYDQKYKQLDIHKSDNCYAWLELKKQECDNKYEDLEENETEIIDSLTREMERIEAEIIADRNEITELEKDIDSRKKEKKREVLQIKIREKEIAEIKSKKNYQTATIEIENIEDMEQAELKRIRQALSKINKTVTINEDLEDISRMNVGLKSEENKQESITINAKGQIVGECCTQNTQDATRQLVSLMLENVYEIPFQDKENLSISFKITGHADWRGAGSGLLNVYYEALQDIDEGYKNHLQERKKFMLWKGQKKQITNEELAFLRAYCAYTTALDILESQNLKVDNLVFTAIEHFQKDDTNGEAFRGVDLQMYVNGLDQYYQRLIEEEEAKIIISKTKIREIKAEVLEKNSNIVRIEKRIKMKYKQIDEIIKQIEAAEDNIVTLRNRRGRYNTKQGDTSQANHIIKTIKDDTATYNSKKKRKKKVI